MRIWTIQPPIVMSTLRREGEFKAEWSLIPKEWLDDVEPAYRWMADQHERRVGGLNGHPVIWAWPQRPVIHSRYRRPCHLLEFDVPESSVLGSDIHVWSSPLSNCWAWTQSDLNELDALEAESGKSETDAWEARQPITKEQSWERVFLLSEESFVQLTISRLKLNELVSFKRFRGRPR